MRISEIYASVQGEGPNVGKTTVFTRFGGCNLRCPGWPCDTQHAIDPAYRAEWEKLTWQEVLNNILKVANISGARTVTLTGGEPFLQQRDELYNLVRQLQTAGYFVDCFSNGTILYPAWAPENIQFIMDWKLPGSGEYEVGQHNRVQNLKQLSGDRAVFPQSVKFVCKDFTDLQVAHSLWSSYLAGGNVRTYYGKVWDGDITDAELIEYVMKNQLPWFHNMQVHNIIWPANERGR